uniref:Transmembrane protein n=1 Tax=Pithovirus LCPAC406 TaxID=2506599 RepID=A0A481ZED6_9VIRU|nr:MAG: hypothetical protein LCPAC406_03100 [Pithovirus LCPAC406]
MEDISSKSINFREAAILAVAIVLATAIVPLGLIFVFERDKPEHVFRPISIIEETNRNTF